MRKFKKFLDDVSKEWAVISWPAWEELKGSTMVVIIFTILVCIFLFTSDQIMNNAVKVILG